MPWDDEDRGGAHQRAQEAQAFRLANAARASGGARGNAGRGAVGSGAAFAVGGVAVGAAIASTLSDAGGVAVAPSDEGTPTGSAP
jgi:hypothetical protein